MSIDLSSLEARYVDFCKRQEVQPHFVILSGFSKAKLQKSRNELCSLQVFLDHLKDVDFPPLIDAFSAINVSEIDAVDILHESPCVLNGEYVLSLMRAVNEKLRVVDLHDLSFGKDFLRYWPYITCEFLPKGMFVIITLPRSLLALVKTTGKSSIMCSKCEVTHWSSL